MSWNLMISKQTIVLPTTSMLASIEMNAVTAVDCTATASVLYTINDIKIFLEPKESPTAKFTLHDKNSETKSLAWERKDPGHKYC